MSSSSPAADLLGQYLAAIARSDVTAATSLFSDDVVLHTPCMPEPTPKVMTGRAAITPVLQYVFGAVFKKFTWTELEIHTTDDPNLAFALAKSHVELQDGRIYSNDYAIYARVRDGKIVEETEFFDTTRAAKAFAPA